MAVVADSLRVSASVAWEQTKENSTGTFRETAQGPDAISYGEGPSATTYNEIYLGQFTLAAAATSTVNLNSFTNLLGDAKTITKALGLLVTATNAVTGGQLKVEPGAANPIDFWLSGTTPAITLSCGAGGSNGCCLLIADATTRVISATVKNVLFTNPGTQTITVTLAVLLGT